MDKLSPSHSLPNPSFRVYDLDRETYYPLNYVQHRLYIEEANKKLKDEWKIAYTFLNYYEVPNMQPQSFEKIIERAEDETEYFKKVLKMYSNEAYDGHYLPPEDERMKLLCKFKAWNMHEYKNCMTPYGNFSDYTQFFLVNDWIIGNWSHIV